MHRLSCPLSLFAAATTAIGLAAASPAFADPIADFYKGKTMELIVGYPPGGANDVFSRSLTRHLGKYIPGNPNIISRNMPGAGSLLAANYIYSLAPKDGTIIGIITPTAPLDEKLGNSAVKYQSAKFGWLGRIGPAVNPLMVWGTQPYTSWKDALTQEITLSATGVGSTVSVYPTVLNNVMKTKFKMVMGYKGSGEAMLAMERGEVAGHATALEAVLTQHPTWIKDKTVKVLGQFALTRHAVMPDAPTVLEMAETDEQKAILRAVMNATEIGKPVLTTPGVPADRLAALRRAYEKVCEDAEFKAEFARQGVELAPINGEALQKLVEDVANISPELLAKVKANYGG
jgi:tripartite-type tricarboxylate transporter receptor subunit TctC